MGRSCIQSKSKRGGLFWRFGSTVDLVIVSIVKVASRYGVIP
jgi:hypothetical protein